MSTVDSQLKVEHQELIVHRYVGLEYWSNPLLVKPGNGNPGLHCVSLRTRTILDFLAEDVGVHVNGFLPHVDSPMLLVIWRGVCNAGGRWGGAHISWGAERSRSMFHWAPRKAPQGCDAAAGGIEDLRGGRRCSGATQPRILGTLHSSRVVSVQVCFSPGSFNFLPLPRSFLSLGICLPSSVRMPFKQWPGGQPCDVSHLKDVEESASSMSQLSKQTASNLCFLR